MNPNTPHTPHDFANQDQTLSASGLNSYDAPVQLAPGKIIMDKFVVIEHLGTGGMGSVFKVQHLHLQTFYALKCLNHKQGNDAIWRRFENEARAANRLDHPNLIKVHDSGLLPDGQPYFVMDLVEGTTLSQELTARGTLTLAQALKIFIQVGFAISYAHANGVVHRDIKPSNIMLVKNTSGSLGGTVKVVDFGIAKLTGKDEFNQQTLTKTGEIFGSPLYMSPEQCMGIAVDHRSDLYSLGCVMYEALTGAPPVVGDNALSTMLKHQSETPSAMRQASMGLDFPDSIEYVVAKLLEKDPNNRYQNASLLTADLVAIEQGHIFKEHELGDNRKTLIAMDRAAKPAKKVDSHVVTIIWSILMLTIGLVVGFFAGRINPGAQNDQAGSQQKPVEKTYIQVPPSETPLISSLARADNQPFSTLLHGSKTRLFKFPTDISLGEIYDESWAGNGKNFGIAKGNRTFENFAPFYMNFEDEISAYPNVFAKFRPDELAGVKINGFSQNTSEILKSISNYSGLEYLSLAGTTIQNNDLSALNQMKNLKHLMMPGSSITGDDVARLTCIKQLETLDCGYIPNMSPALEKLKDCKNFRGLHLCGCNLTEKDLNCIVQFSKLQFLDLTNNAALNDQSISKIAKLSKLRELDLDRCKITTASIPALQKLPDLKYLHLGGQIWSQEDRIRLEKALPHAKVVWGKAAEL